MKKSKEINRAFFMRYLHANKFMELSITICYDFWEV